MVRYVETSIVFRSSTYNTTTDSTCKNHLNAQFFRAYKGRYGNQDDFEANKRMFRFLKDDGIMIQQMQFSESLEFRGVLRRVWEPESHTPQP